MHGTHRTPDRECNTPSAARQEASPFPASTPDEYLDTPTSALTAATTKLRQDPPAVLDALGLVHRAEGLVRVWRRLSQPCQTPSGGNEDEREACWQQALDFSAALVHLLVARGILTLDAPPAFQAQQVASILLAHGAEHPQADVAALCRAALMLDDQLLLWRQHALASVRNFTDRENANHDLLFPLLHEALEVLAAEPRLVIGENWEKEDVE